MHPPSRRFKMDIKTVASFIIFPFRFLGKRWGILPLHTEAAPTVAEEQIGLYELLEGPGDPTSKGCNAVDDVIRLAQSVELYVTGKPGSFILKTGTYVDDYTNHTTEQQLGIFATFKRISEESDPISRTRTIVITGCKTMAQNSPMEYFKATELTQGDARTIIISWKATSEMEWCTMRTLYKNVQQKTPGRNTIGVLPTVYDLLPPPIQKTNPNAIRPTEVFQLFQQCVSQRRA